MTKKQPVVLFRKDIVMEEEHEIAAKHFHVYESRNRVPNDSRVIARYSALPYYMELEADLQVNGAQLLNTYKQHQWVAQMDWAYDEGVLKGLTPKTYFGSNYYKLPEGAYVLKGRTNSRKNKWGTHMFAPTKAQVQVVATRLLDDELIYDQGLVIREYIPLKQLDTAINGLPIVNEWRTFWYGTHLLASGYYWQASHPESEEKANFSHEGLDLAYKAAELVAPHVPFFVLDVAEKEDGGWTVVEVNDGQMSGLCGCKADDLYGTLKRLLLE